MEQEQLVHVTVSYRNKDIGINIDPKNHVIDLKNDVFRLTSVKPDKFVLKINETEMIDTKKLSDFTKFGTNFKMIKVIILITVEINGINHPWNVPESYSVFNFIRHIAPEYGYDEQMSLYHKGKKLNDTSTFMLCGVENNDVLTAKDLKPATKVIITVTVSYKDKVHSIKINEESTVLQLKERVSQLTMIEVENFCLKQGRILLLDSKPISKYIECGTNFEMANVTIKVIVVFNGDISTFHVNESSTINAFKKDIEKSGHSPDFNLYFENNILIDTKTVQSEGIEDNSVVITVKKNPIISQTQTFTVEYRSVSQSFDVDTAKTVADLKILVQQIFGINTEHFSLAFHWIILKDEISLSEYIKYGTRFTMTDVTICVFVTHEDRIYNFSVKESMKIMDFKKNINEKNGRNHDYVLYYNNQIIDDKGTLLESEVQHKGTIFVASKLYGGCRYC